MEKITVSVGVCIDGEPQESLERELDVYETPQNGWLLFMPHRFHDNLYLTVGQLGLRYDHAQRNPEPVAFCWLNVKSEAEVDQIARRLEIFGFKTANLFGWLGRQRIC